MFRKFPDKASLQKINSQTRVYYTLFQNSDSSVDYLFQAHDSLMKTLEKKYQDWQFNSEYFSGFKRIANFLNRFVDRV